ncbi:MAG: DegT/DnrJ/EryC1/StrS family aminotransferase [Candidatus Omnitrophota bacterium]
MKVPFVDFLPQYQETKKEINLGLKSVFKKSNFILGQQVKDFENEFSQYSDARYGIGVNSGTDALHLALRALGVKEGDEVIVPAYTFIATALAVSYTGAKVVFADIEEDTFNLDPQGIRKAITPRTKAILPVHLYGQAANLNEILAIAKEKNIAVIEDCAQAHGALYQNKKVGSFGLAGCFSFYPTKGLGAFGDGGMIITRDEDFYKKVLMLRDYGRKDRYEHIIKGYNSRLDTLQAVVLSAKLKHFDRWNAMRQKAAQQYMKFLSQIKGVMTPLTRKDRTHVFQTFTIRVKNRDVVCQKMQDAGIGVLIHYPIPLHLQKAYEELGYKKGDFPVSEKVASEILSIPMFPHITNKQIEYVCKTLKDIVQNG